MVAALTSALVSMSATINLRWMGTNVRFSKVKKLRSLKLCSVLAGTTLTRFSMRMPK